MITVNGWCARGMGGGGYGDGEMCVQSIGEMGKDFYANFLQPFLENIGSLFQYFTTLTENAGPLLRRWLAPWRTL